MGARMGGRSEWLAAERYGPCDVTRVIDGDTTDVKCGEAMARVRLLNIDTPERGKVGYPEAKQALERMVRGRAVYLEFEAVGRPRHDPFGRLLVYLISGEGENLNVDLVREGMSRFYRKYGEGRFPALFARAEELAKTEGRGMWSRPRSSGGPAPLGAVASPSVTAHGGEPPDTHGNVAASAVKILVSFSAPDAISPWQRQSPATGTGSGVVISGRRILTNAHVVADHASIEVQRAGSAERCAAEIEHVCHTCDLAILRVPDVSFFEGTTPLAIGDLPSPQDPIDVYGFPEGGEGLSITRGVVSRIEVGEYVHSREQLLRVQVDSAINPGNSGGPAVSDGKLVGIAMQTLEDAENAGYLVPTPVIRHFLEDVEDGRYDGFPELGLQMQTLQNAALRRRFGLGDDSGGVLVIAVTPSGSARGRIQPGDVLLALDGVPIREDGSVEIDGLPLEWTVLEHGAQVAGRMTATLLRSGASIQESLELKAPDPLIDWGETTPYRIFAGLVFQPLTLRYLATFEATPAHLSSYFENPPLVHGALARPAPSEAREEVVVLSGVLSSELTRGYEGFQDEVIYSVDDVPVRSLVHLSTLLDGVEGEFVNIVLERGGVIAVPRDLAGAQGDEVLARYSVRSDRSANLALPADAAE